MIYAIISVLVIALLIGSSAISGGIMLGLVIATGLAVVYSQLPQWTKRFIVRFRLIFDALISGAVFVTIHSNTATGLVGAATCGLLVTLLLHHQSNKMVGQSTVASDAQSLLKSLKTM